MRIVITIEDGALTGVYTDGDPAEVIVDLVDYDNVKADTTGTLEQEAIDTESEIKNNTLKSCW